MDQFLAPVDAILLTQAAAFIATETGASGLTTNPERLTGLM